MKRASGAAVQRGRLGPAPARAGPPPPPFDGVTGPSMPRSGLPLPPSPFDGVAAPPPGGTSAGGGSHLHAPPPPRPPYATSLAGASPALQHLVLVLCSASGLRTGAACLTCWRIVNVAYAGFLGLARELYIQA